MHVSEYQYQSQYVAATQYNCMHKFISHINLTVCDGRAEVGKPKILNGILIEIFGSERTKHLMDLWASFCNVRSFNWKGAVVQLAQHCFAPMSHRREDDVSKDTFSVLTSLAAAMTSSCLAITIPRLKKKVSSKQLSENSVSKKKLAGARNMLVYSIRFRRKSGSMAGIGSITKLTMLC